MARDLEKQNAAMKSYLQSLPEQVQRGYALGEALKLPARYLSAKQILFCGVGGSAIGMDILAQAMRESCRIPFSVHRGDKLPRWVGPETLVVLTSCSGDTRETLEALREAEKRSARILAVTSGGVLAREASRKKFPCVLIPSGMPPRTAVGYLTFALGGVLVKGGWVDFSAREAAAVSAVIPRLISKAASLARQLRGRMIFLYGEGASFEVVMKRWRAQFAENSKTLCSYHSMPEMFHNEMEGWSFPEFLPEKSAVIFFRDRKEPRELRAKTDLAVKFVKASGALVFSVISPEASSFRKVFPLIAFGDWVSFELARLNKVDPIEIPVIRKIKETR